MARRKDKDGLYQRERSPYWWASYTDASGKRVRRSTGARTKGEAQQILAKWKLEVREQTHWGAEPKRSFDELILEYLNGPSTEKRSHKRDKFSAQNLYRFFTGELLDNITPKVIRAYIESRKEAGVTPATINRELSMLSRAFNWARTHLEWNVHNPVSGMKLREPAGRIRWITHVEAKSLLRAAQSNPRLHSFITLGLATGMRSGEMVSLEWDRVDLKKGEVFLDTMHQKNRKRSIVPLNEEARSALLSQAKFRSEHCPDSPWVFAHEDGQQVKSFKKGFEGACRRAGIEDFTPHDMRHTVASWLVQNDVPIRQVCELLRHSSITVTMRYAHLAPSNVRDAVNILSSHFSHT
jgi:integrase